MNRKLWREEVERWGYRRAAYARLMSAGERLLGVYVFHVTAGQRGRSTPRPAPDGVRVGACSREEMLVAARDPVMELDAALVTLAFDRGDECNGAVADGKVVGYQFLSNAGSAPHNNDVWIEYGPEYTYSYKHFVHPAWRGQRLPMRPPASGDPPPGSPTKSFGFIATHNFASLARVSKENPAHSLVGIAGYAERFGAFFGFRTRGVRDIEFRFVRAPAGAPRIDVDRGQ
jgi:hypothetical protein